MRSDIRPFDLVLNFGAMLSEKVLALFTGLAATALLTRHLGISGYGDYTLAVSHTLLFLPFASWGVELICLRELARRPAQAAQILGQTFGIRIVLSMGAALLAVAAAWAAHYPERLFLAVALTAVSLPASAWETGSLLLQARIRYSQVAGISLIGNLFSLAWVGWGVWHDWGVLPLLAGSSGAVWLRSFAFYILSSRACVLRPTWGIFGGLKLLRESTPMALSGLLMAVNTRLDLLLVAKWASRESAALYAAPVVFFQTLSFLPQAMAATFFPVLTQWYPSHPERLQRWSRQLLIYSWVLAFPIAFGGMAVAADLVRLLFGPNFTGSTQTFFILSAAQIFIFSTPLVGFLMLAVGAQKQNLVMNAGVTAAGVLINFLLIPRWAQAGAAVTWTLVSAAIFFLGLRVLAPFVRLKLPLGFLWRVGVPALLMAGAVPLFSFLPVLARIGLGALFYAALLAVCTHGYRDLHAVS